MVPATVTKGFLIFPVVSAAATSTNTPGNCDPRQIIVVAQPGCVRGIRRIKPLLPLARGDLPILNVLFRSPHDESVTGPIELRITMSGG